MNKPTEQVFIIKTLTECTNAEDWLDEVKNIAISNALCGLEDLLSDEFCGDLLFDEFGEEEYVLDRIYKCINEYRKELE